MREFDDRFFSGATHTNIRLEEEERLMKSLAPQYGYPYINLNGIAISPKALMIITEEDARAAKIVGFEIKNKHLSVAIRNPNNPATKTIIDKLNEDWKLSIFLCSEDSLEHGWDRYNDQRQTTAVKKGILDIDPETIDYLKQNLTKAEDVATKIKDVRSLNTARRVSDTLEILFAGALGLKASDIHIEPDENGVRIRYRLDGVLHDVVDLEPKIYSRLSSRLKLLSGLRLNVQAEAQDGRFTFTLSEREIEVRVSVIPGAEGESYVMRLLDPGVASFDMEQLGLNTALHDVMSAELERPNGMIITTGPTGSGKTTALYAFLRSAHSPEVKIITIEDPVEYKVDDIVQTQVEGDYTFASGLRAVLRQDPDIIMVGEIRDREVAETAVHAAQTGHLVFSTLHTNSAVGAFPRLIDLGVDYRLVGSAVNIILGQRLVRILCEHCKQKKIATFEEQTLIEKVVAGHPLSPTIPDELNIYEPKPDGCPECNLTGFKGRQGVFEAIKMDKAVEEAVMRDPREHIIQEAARPQGIPTMAEDGVAKVLQGITSLSELERVVDLRNPRGAAKKPEAEEDSDFSSHVV